MGKWKDLNKRRFICHKLSAKRRGIPFEFTLDEWVSWWEDNLGHGWQSLRGCKMGQYVMARKGDKGSYSLENVKCILTERNHNEVIQNGTSTYGEKNGQSKLTEGQVIEIFKSSKSQSILAEQYSVDKSAISLIKTRKRWAYLTEGEDRG
jgi:hypothetical protein